MSTTWSKLDGDPDATVCAQRLRTATSPALDAGRDHAGELSHSFTRTRLSPEYETGPDTISRGSGIRPDNGFQGVYSRRKWNTRTSGQPSRQLELEARKLFKHAKPFGSFSADDIPKAKDFYERTLGLEVTETNGILSLQLDPDTAVLVYPKPDHVPAVFTILNFPVANIDEAVDGLTGRGVRFEIYDEDDLKTDERGVFRDGGPNIAWFKDPAGNILSVIEQD